MALPRPSAATIIGMLKQNLGMQIDHVGGHTSGRRLRAGLDIVLRMCDALDVEGH